MEVHYGNGPVDGVGGTIKNQVFQEVKSSRLTVSTPKEFSDAVQKLLFLLLLLSIYIYIDDTCVCVYKNYCPIHCPIFLSKFMSILHVK